MVAMKTYTATFSRDRDGVWLVELAEEPRVHTFGRSLCKAREHIRDATALWFDVGPESFELVDDIRLPRKTKVSVERARAERSRAVEAQERALEQTRAVARVLVEGERLSMRDAADLLGLSHQRVQQLLAAAG
jgi:predicted RNase H-like HicB family nuclease